MCTPRYCFQATDVDSGTTIFALSGTPSEISAEYESTGNEVTLTFTSDTDTNLEGWRVVWTRVDPTTTTIATTPACKWFIIYYHMMIYVYIYSLRIIGYFKSCKRGGLLYVHDGLSTSFSKKWSEKKASIISINILYIVFYFV